MKNRLVQRAEEPIQMTDTPDIVHDYDYRTPTERNLNNEKGDDPN